ncbi:MAG: 1,6-anhydro-N-acetylmuramyl-L-alanine amidase AmpD [Burkholderiaceae bacterium]|nr:1,6-anhydro-N-acetylmuramyl-L-alanine amidase AmpD [Burkholderiaceae bacterium]
MNRIDYAIDAAGWCGAALRQPSPNCDARPEGLEIDLLVVHNISLPAGQFGTPYIYELFSNRIDTSADSGFAELAGLRVSAHFLVARDGRLTQFVSTLGRAWHAGLSEHLGRERCNDFSIGIELEGSDDVPFEEVQYRVLAGLTEALAAAHPLRWVAGHEHIAPGRKTDPGPHFDWARYRASLDPRDVGELHFP